MVEDSPPPSSSPCWRRTQLPDQITLIPPSRPCRLTPHPSPSTPRSSLRFCSRVSDSPVPRTTRVRFFLPLSGSNGLVLSQKLIGEALSPLPVGSGDNVGEMRLQSDFLISRDPRTACAWQGFVDEQVKMAIAFRAAMAKLALVGQDTSKFVDCSEVVPNPVAPTRLQALYVYLCPLIGFFFYRLCSFPATKTKADLQLSCNSPFPSLATAVGASETIIP